MYKPSDWPDFTIDIIAQTGDRRNVRQVAFPYSAVSFANLACNLGQSIVITSYENHSKSIVSQLNRNGSSDTAGGSCNDDPIVMHRRR